jgi:hypothetical protein
MWGGIQSRSHKGDSQTARWAMALDALAVTLLIAGNMVGVAIVR